VVQIKRWELSTPHGDHQIHSLSMLVGDDLLSCFWGGTKPHIGAVALALPRASIADPSVISSTSSVLTLLGHKEDAVAKPVSERLSARLNRNVVVSAGMHWDHLDQESIAQIIDDCLWLADRIAATVEKEA
jgi:hypothetical protein